MKTKLFALGTVVLLGAGVGGAFAAEVACPGGGLNPPAITRVFYSDTNPAAMCWDYGPGNASGTNEFVEFVAGAPSLGDDGASLDDGKGVLQLPTTVSHIGQFDANNAALNFGPLTISNVDADGGTWTVNGLLGEFFLLFKVGNNENPTWAAFKMPAGLLTGTWSTDPDNGGGISHISLYGNLCPNGVCDPNTEVPLPAAAWLLLSGLAGLGVVSRRRKTA